MKKLSLALASVLVIFTACQKEEPIQGSDVNSSRLTFAITAGGSSGTTKAAIYGQEPDVNVANVKVYAFAENGGDFLYTKTFDITNWTAEMLSIHYDVDDGDMLPDGTYKFLAVGRNATDTYTLPTIDATTSFDDFAVSVAAVGDEDDIYAGSSQYSIVGDGARVEIDMKRNVAGVLGYFKNIPQEVNGTTVRYLRLSVNAANLGVNLTTGAGTSPDAGTSFNLINIDLSTQTVTEGIYDGNDVPTGVVKLDGTQLAGRHVIPVENITLTLGLYGTDGTTLLDSWSINNGGSSTFSLSANNFYAIGQKIDAGSTNGGTTDVTTDDDNAVDLLSDQELTISIIPAWDVINNLTIE